MNILENRTELQAKAQNHPLTKEYDGIVFKVKNGASMLWEQVPSLEEMRHGHKIIYTLAYVPSRSSAYHYIDKLRENGVEKVIDIEEDLKKISSANSNLLRAKTVTGTTSDYYLENGHMYMDMDGYTYELVNIKVSICGQFSFMYRDFIKNSCVNEEVIYDTMCYILEDAMDGNISNASDVVKWANNKMKILDEYMGKNKISVEIEDVYVHDIRTESDKNIDTKRTWTLH